MIILKNNGPWGGAPNGGDNNKGGNPWGEKPRTSGMVAAMAAVMAVDRIWRI